ncbi:hypothetical protein PVL29_011985 [Vitis rotundifolia]|uniref:Enoyl reductase (ER) domain-containing protein n=1 Tax=Vitis rotundifolia TaxID=103349 RepID=A0AA38ZRI7_VITRO|nr:hypothetical protein PVL29_011985 [Vitis rotundifolia]
MKAVVIATSGDPQVLQVQEVENLEIGDDEVLIRYPGLECSGIIKAVGKVVVRWKVGDQVCSLLSGEGHAEKLAVPAGQVLPVPSGVSLKDAAGIPEVACTVWSTVLMMSRLSAGETFLVHGGSIGIGMFAIQRAKYQRARVFVIAVDVCINYKTEDIPAWVEETGGKGIFYCILTIISTEDGIAFYFLVHQIHYVNVILDNIGRAYFWGDIDSLNVDGRLFIIGFQGGTVAEANLLGLLARRLTVQVAGLRNRSLENKSVIVSEVEKNVWPIITGVQVFSIDGSNKGSPAHGKQ